MNDDPVDLDAHRGMSAQRATELRRQKSGVQADQAALKLRQEEFEEFLLSKPAATKKEAASKARYLLELYAATTEGGDPRRSLLIIRALNDLDRLFKLNPGSLAEPGDEAT
jgi:hypothetical protein